MLALLTLTAVALGADPTFEEGVKLYQESSYEQAIFRFEEIAVRMDIEKSDKATALMWLGLSYAGTGDLVAADRSFRYALKADVNAVIPTETSPAIVEMVEKIRVELTPPPPPVVEAPPPPPPPPPPEPAPSAGVVVGGVTAAVGVIAVISGGMFAFAAADQRAKAFDPDLVPDDADAVRESAEASAMAASVLFTAGAVLGVAGGAVVALNLE